MLRKNTCVPERLRSCCTRFKLKRVGQGCNGPTGEETIPLAEWVMGAQPGTNLTSQNEVINPECPPKEIQIAERSLAMGKFVILKTKFRDKRIGAIRHSEKGNSRQVKNHIIFPQQANYAHPNDL